VPELPEVETIARDLNRHARGRRIREVIIHAPKLVVPLTVNAFQGGVRGKTILGVKRRGKFLLVSLGVSARKPTHILLWHMRMTGHPLFRDERKETPEDRSAFADSRNRHIRLSFRFTDGTRLDYSDVRKFGTLHLVDPDHISTHRSLVAMGPDALDPSWTAEKLHEALRKRKKAIKVALLDQTVIAGIGKIYADEILRTARLHPLLPTRRLTLADVRRMFRAIRTVLPRAVRARGTSIDDYRDLRGRGGKYGNVRRIYQRTGMPCFRCGATIARIVVGGRGTHVCPQCQRHPRP